MPAKVPLSEVAVAKVSCSDRAAANSVPLAWQTPFCGRGGQWIVAGRCEVVENVSRCLADQPCRCSALADALSFVAVPRPAAARKRHVAKIGPARSCAVCKARNAPSPNVFATASPTMFRVHACQ
eukprot:237396-Chlamydomonas_euryale.AAC.7